jgi:hypothetical protein
MVKVDYLGKFIVSNFKVKTGSEAYINLRKCFDNLSECLKSNELASNNHKAKSVIRLLGIKTDNPDYKFFVDNFNKLTDIIPNVNTLFEKLINYFIESYIKIDQEATKLKEKELFYTSVISDIAPITGIDPTDANLKDKLKLTIVLLGNNKLLSEKFKEET